MVLFSTSSVSGTSLRVRLTKLRLVLSKFSYLKEFLIPRVRLLIDGLFFTSEGYSRSKSILLGKFGKSTEIAAAHTLYYLATCYSKFTSKPNT